MHVHCYHHSISLTTRLYKRRHFWRSSQWIQLKFLWNRKLFLLLDNFKTIIKTIIKRPPLKTVFSKHSLINNFEKNQQTAFSGYHFISVSNYCYVKMYEDTDWTNIGRGREIKNSHTLRICGFFLSNAILWLEPVSEWHTFEAEKIREMVVWNNCIKCPFSELPTTDLHHSLLQFKSPRN